MGRTQPTNEDLRFLYTGLPVLSVTSQPNSSGGCTIPETSHSESRPQKNGCDLDAIQRTLSERNNNLFIDLVRDSNSHVAFC